MYQRLWQWGPVLIWCLVIFMFSHQPKAVLAPLQPSTIVEQPGFMLFGMDADTLLGKSAHVLLFAVLGVLLYRATQRYWLTIVLALLYAGVDEWHQSFVPGRTPRFGDVGFDMVGVIIGLLALMMIAYWRQLQRPRYATVVTKKRS